MLLLLLLLLQATGNNFLTDRRVDSLRASAMAIHDHPTTSAKLEAAMEFCRVFKKATRETMKAKLPECHHDDPLEVTR